MGDGGETIMNKRKVLQTILLIPALFYGKLMAADTGKDTGAITVDRLVHVGKLDLPHGYSAGYFLRKGNFVYLTHGESGRRLEVIDVSNPEEPKSAQFMNHGRARLFAQCLDGNLLLCTDSSDNIIPFDITEPEKPKKLAAWHPEGMKNLRIVMRGKYLFVSGVTPEKTPYYVFRIYMVEGGFQPKLVSTLNLPLNKRLKELLPAEKKGGKSWHSVPGMVCLDGNLLHVAFGHVLFGIDITNPDSPQVAYTYESSGLLIRNIAAKNKTVFVSLYRSDEKSRIEEGIAALDISAADNIRALGFLKMSAGRMVLSGNRLFVGAWETTSKEERSFKGIDLNHGLIDRNAQVAVIDISHPAGMKVSGRWRFAQGIGPVADMMIDGNYLLAGTDMSGFHVLDVSEPAGITQVNYTKNAGGEGRGLVVSGNFAYILTDRYSPHNIHTVDISAPEKPELVHTLYVPGALEGHQWFQVKEKPGEPLKFLYLLGGDPGHIVVIDVTTPAEPKVERIIQIPDGWKFGHQPPCHIYDAGERIFILCFRVEKGLGQTALISMLKEEEGRNLKLESATVIPGVTGAGMPGGYAGNARFFIEDERCYIVSLEPSDATDFISVELVRHKPVERTRMPMVKLSTLDVANPQKPALIASVLLHQAKIYHRFAYQKIACHNKILYILGEGGAPQKGQLPQALYVYDVHDPAQPLFLSSRQDKYSSSVYLTLYNMTFIPEYSLLLTEHFMNGLSLIDVSNPLQPSVLWREPLAREYDDDILEPTYRRQGFHAGAYKDGYLYVARISHLDVFKLKTAPAESKTSAARLKRIKETLTKSLAFKTRNTAEKNSILMMQKAVKYHLANDELAEAEVYKDGIELLMEEGLALEKEPMVSIQANVPIRIDGKPDEWLDVPGYQFKRNKATVKSQWDSEYLYFLFEVKDDAYDPPGEEEGIWAGDSVEIYLNTTLLPGMRDYGCFDYQFIFSPANRGYIHFNNPRFLERSAPVFSQVAGERTRDGYAVEIAISSLEIYFTPSKGSRIGWASMVTEMGNGIPGGMFILTEKSSDQPMHYIESSWRQLELK